MLSRNLVRTVARRAALRPLSVAATEDDMDGSAGLSFTLTDEQKVALGAEIGYQ